MRLAQVSGLGEVWGKYTPDVLDREDRGTVAGGEAAMLQTSFGLARRGHDVTVYYPGERAEYQKVKFRPLSEAYLDVLAGKFPTVVSWSDRNVLRLAPEGTVRIFSQQLNDVPLDDDEFWSSIDAFVSPSLGHLQFLTRFAPSWAHIRTAVVSSGSQAHLHIGASPLSERKHVVSYWSSPDRGLHHLLLLWPKVVEAVPDAELRVFYLLDRFRESIRGHWEHEEVCWRGFMLDQLLDKARFGEIPNVQFLGALPRKTLAKHQMETKVWAFPFDPVAYTEGFSVSTLDAITAGCYAVARPEDALEEVYGDAVSWVRAQVCDAEWRERFAAEIVRGLLAEDVPNKEDRQLAVDTYTWDNAAAQLEGVFQ